MRCLQSAYVFIQPLPHVRTVTHVLLTLLTSQDASHLRAAVAMGAQPLGRGQFAPPLSTQPSPAATQLPATIPEAEQEDHEASYAPDGADVLEDTEAATVTPLTFQDVLSEAQLKTNGLGPDGALLFPKTSKSGHQVTQLFFDRVLLRKVLLLGSAEVELSKLVDKMADKILAIPKPGERGRSTRVRPSLLEAGVGFASQSQVSQLISVGIACYLSALFRIDIITTFLRAVLP